MLPCRHNTLQRTDCPLPPFLSVFSSTLGLACLLRFEKISFPSTSNGRCSSSFPLDLHQTTQYFDSLIFCDHCSCSNSDKLDHTTTVGPSSSPQNFRSPRPADWKKGGADITASPSSLLALLIFCSARSIDHFSDLYPASSFSSVRLVSSWMTVISSCSRSNHHFCKNSNCCCNCPPYVRLHACNEALCSFKKKGCLLESKWMIKYDLLPSVVFILVLPRRSSQSSDSARILTYPPFGISWSKNQFMPISACTSRSGRSRGSSTASGLEGASHCICRFTRAGPFLLDAFLRWSGLVFNRLHCVLVWSSWL